MSFGIKVSKPGNDVFTAGKGDLFVDTTYPILKIKASGTGSLSVSDGGSDSDTIAHDLGYVPKVLVYGQYYDIYSGAKSTNYLRYPKDQLQVTDTSSFGYTIDTEDLIITGAFSNSSGDSETFSYFYYIFYDAF